MTTWAGLHTVIKPTYLLRHEMTMMKLQLMTYLRIVSLCVAGGGGREEKEEEGKEGRSRAQHDFAWYIQPHVDDDDDDDDVTMVHPASSMVNQELCNLQVTRVTDLLV